MTADELTQARERLLFAKSRWTAVAVDVLHGRADVAQTQSALAELTAAQAELATLTAPVTEAGR